MARPIPEQVYRAKYIKENIYSFVFLKSIFLAFLKRYYCNITDEYQTHAQYSKQMRPVLFHAGMNYIYHNIDHLLINFNFLRLPIVA